MQDRLATKRSRAPDGKLAGLNRIERGYGRRVLRERYATGRGYGGACLNIYEASGKAWHQTWVDSSGLLLLLEGGIREGNSVLEGRAIGTDTRLTEHRIT